MSTSATIRGADSHSIYRDRWIAIARTEDVPHRHVFQARLCGEELAVWRDSAERINVWVNRCPHRGVRLTIGSHRGDQLKCRYHGWSYATGSGRCVLIPAHPDEPPPARIGVTVFPALERSGFIWTAQGHPTGEPVPIEHIAADHHRLRSQTFRASADAVATALVRHRFTPLACDVQRVDPLTIAVRYGEGAARETLVWLLQPADAAMSIVHGIRSPARSSAHWIDAARRLNASLHALRDALEAGQ